MKTFKITAAAMLLAIGLTGLFGCRSINTAAPKKTVQTSDKAYSVSEDYTGNGVSLIASEAAEAAYGTVLCHEQMGEEALYSFDGGKTWLPESEANETLNSLDIEWWTYEEFAQYAEAQKQVYYGYLNENVTGYINGEYFVWDDAHVEAAVKQLENDLESIKNGCKISKIISEINVDASTVECICMAEEMREAPAREYSYELETLGGATYNISGSTKEELVTKVEAAAKKLLDEGLLDNEAYEKIIKAVKN